jgi:hypothetical protein
MIKFKAFRDGFWEIALFPSATLAMSQANVDVQMEYGPNILTFRKQSPGVGKYTQV